MFSTFTHNLKVKFRAAFARITLSRISTTFFILAFIHFFVQGVLQAYMHSFDSRYISILDKITTAAQVPRANFPWLSYNDGNYTLRLCHDIPIRDSEHCIPIFQSGVALELPPTFPSEVDKNGNPFATRSVSDVKAYHGVDNTIIGVTLSTDGGQNIQALTPLCTRTLVYAHKVINDQKRESYALISVQFWLIAISSIAIIYDSVPHTATVFITRILLVIWSVFGIWRTHHHHEAFKTIFFAEDSPCNVDLFPSYFSTRARLEIPDLALNCTALVLSGYLSIRLLLTYRSQSFKSVGAPPGVSLVYRYFMATLACLHLSVFILVTAMALWIDTLANTYIRHISEHTTIYVGLVILTVVLIVPWIILGWYAIRNENKVLMVGYLLVGFFFVGGWGAMFYSQVYRWSFLQWHFLAVMTVGSFIVLIASLALGIKCWLNFGKGLREYLNVEDALSSSEFSPEVFSNDIEKGKIDDEDFLQDATKYSISDTRSSTASYFVPTLHSGNAVEQSGPSLSPLAPNRLRGTPF